VVVGLGPAGPELITAAARAAIDAVPAARRFVRTRRHPSAEVVGPEATSFDSIYDGASTLDQVYPAIVARLREAALSSARASAPGPILYAVPGSPLVAERTVELLRAEEDAGEDIELTIVPGLSFLDLAWARLGIDPLASGVRLVDGHRFAVEAAGGCGPLLVAQCDSPQVLSEIKLSVPAFDDAPAVTVLRRLGLPGETVTVFKWEDLDRPSAVVLDHLTTLWIPGLATPVAAELVRFDELIRLLREQCPWDRAQTHASLAPHLLEESYETVEAIAAFTAATDTAATGAAAHDVAAHDAAAHLEEELGDVLLQVVLHAAIATQEGWFTLADVARTIHDKMVARHPHVFGEVTAETPGAVQATWDQLKAAERADAGHVESALDGVGGHLPALLHAAAVQDRAAEVGFDWPDVEGPLAKVGEETTELRQAADGGAQQDELGDLLFACVNVSRHLGVDPEVALRTATAKFVARFRRMEALSGGAESLQARGLDLAGLDALWEEAKRGGGNPG
jgi:tetrapyrrole methylase family protein/MazG family protein